MWTCPKEGTTFQEGIIFVFMTLCCDLGQMGGILRETTINNKKPFEMTADFHTLHGLHGHDSRLVVALHSLCVSWAPE